MTCSSVRSVMPSPRPRPRPARPCPGRASTSAAAPPRRRSPPGRAGRSASAISSPMYPPPTTTARRAPVAGDRGPDRLAVVERLHAVHAGGVDAGDVGARPGTAPVPITSWSKPSPYSPPPSRSRTVTAPAVQVDPDRLAAAAARRCPARELGHGPGHQVVGGAHHAADPVRDAAGRVRRVPAALQGDDLQQSPGRRRRACEAAVMPPASRPDHDQPLAAHLRIPIMPPSRSAKAAPTVRA